MGWKLLESAKLHTDDTSGVALKVDIVSASAAWDKKKSMTYEVPPLPDDVSLMLVG
jgi:hypothetical protein